MLEGPIVPSFQFHIAHLIYPKAASCQGLSLLTGGDFPAAVCLRDIRRS
jgi:hypothetical protein